jgi:hypothetical protein
MTNSSPVGSHHTDLVAPTDVAPILEKAKQVAVEYYRATGKPLGVTGEVGEYEAARLLGKLAGAREPGFDAEGPDGKRYQIKARALSETSRRKKPDARIDQVGSHVGCSVVRPDGRALEHVGDLGSRSRTDRGRVVCAGEPGTE